MSASSSASAALPPGVTPAVFSQFQSLIGSLASVAQRSATALPSTPGAAAQPSASLAGNFSPDAMIGMLASNPDLMTQVFNRALETQQGQQLIQRAMQQPAMRAQIMQQMTSNPDLLREGLQGLMESPQSGQIVQQIVQALSSRPEVIGQGLQTAFRAITQGSATAEGSEANGTSASGGQQAIISALQQLFSRLSSQFSSAASSVVQAGRQFTDGVSHQVSYLDSGAFALGVATALKNTPRFVLTERLGLTITKTQHVSARLNFAELSAMSTASALFNLPIAILATIVFLLTFGQVQAVNQFCKKHWAFTAMGVAFVGIGIIGTFSPQAGCIVTGGFLLATGSYLLNAMGQEATTAVRSIFTSNRELLQRFGVTMTPDDAASGINSIILMIQDLRSRGLSQVRGLLTGGSASPAASAS